jgi:hypothetical protein
MELFEFTKIIFERPGDYPAVTPGEKRKQFFMVNRRFAIQYPMQANALQHLKINQAGVVDFWQKFMQQYNGRTPSWMYTKGIKKAKATKETKLSVSVATINEYSKRMEIDRKSIYDAIEFYPAAMKKELKDFEKTIKQK